jgi:hypothetical protein
MDKVFNIDIPKQNMIDFAFKNENIVISFHDKDFELNVDDL